MTDRTDDPLVHINVGPVELEGEMIVPPNARGVVLFAHGSGSSRLSPRNRYVAGVLRDAGFATLLIDLLTREEEQMDQVMGHLRFDIPVLAERLARITDWLLKNPLTRDLGIAYFGASTGGGAALVAAADRPEVVKAIVSRGGRPDLAKEDLPRVKAPTLLIVGSNDPLVLALNRDVMDQISAPIELAVITGATHLFEEAGALEEVARLAANWFKRYLIARGEAKAA
ncbi:MAG TPA: hydrolase [Cyanobacteria bacterium UBA8530]|nr:hydrolase [Cyanobacteria bacterium UBA8530]